MLRSVTCLSNLRWEPVFQGLGYYLSLLKTFNDIKIQLLNCDSGRCPLYLKGGCVNAVAHVVWVGFPPLCLLSAVCTGEGITPWNPEDASTVCGSGGQFILQLKLTGMMSSGVTEAPIVLWLIHSLWSLHFISFVKITIVPDEPVWLIKCSAYLKPQESPIKNIYLLNNSLPNWRIFHNVSFKSNCQAFKIEI